jgi:hypothetical protein
MHVGDEHDTASAATPPRAALPVGEPKRRHRTRTSVTTDGFAVLRCSCGWTVTVDSYADRLRAINRHLGWTVGRLDE